MAASPDQVCQWCKKAVAVGIGDEPGQWLTVAESVTFEDKFYCDGESGDCWKNLMAMARYVRDNFHA